MRKLSQALLPQLNYLAPELARCFTFKRSGGLFGTKYIFQISKAHLHCHAIFSMGVCIAPDTEMWKKPDCWPLIIWDEEGKAHGGVILRTIEHEKKACLVLSINPSSILLQKASAENIYAKIIDAAKQIIRRTGHSRILIPIDSVIFSNRPSIQQIVKEEFAKATIENGQILVTNKNTFSHSPHYSYDTFYVVG